MQSGKPGQIQRFLHQLAQQQPRQIECIQLTNPQSNAIIATTCGYKPISQEQSSLFTHGFAVEPVVPIITDATQKKISSINSKYLSTPVYDSAGQWRYTLSFRSILFQEEINNKPGLLAGLTAVIDEEGKILAHPIASYIGTNIAEHLDDARLKDIVKNAIAGQQNFLHLFLKNNGKELLAGYTAIDSPKFEAGQQKWLILAIASLDDALYGLGQIKLILFTEQGSITITTKVEKINAQPQAVIIVQDTGIGIEPSQQQNLFRPFVMVDNVTTGKFGGTGLGLAISRNLMELMEGSITLESAGLNQGSTVQIALPILDKSFLTSEQKTEQLTSSPC
jgi:hypothetical protein